LPPSYVCEPFPVASPVAKVPQCKDTFSTPEHGPPVRSWRSHLADTHRKRRPSFLRERDASIPLAQRAGPAQDSVTLPREIDVGPIPSLSPGSKPAALLEHACTFYCNVLPPTRLDTAARVTMHSHHVPRQTLFPAVLGSDQTHRFPFPLVPLRSTTPTNTFFIPLNATLYR
jgi:hypothetical protein